MHFFKTKILFDGSSEMLTYALSFKSFQIIKQLYFVCIIAEIEIMNFSHLQMPKILAICKWQMICHLKWQTHLI